LVMHEVDDEPGSGVDATPDRVGEPHDRRDSLRLAADEDQPAELSAQRGHECQHLIRCQVVGIEHRRRSLVPTGLVLDDVQRHGLAAPATTTTSYPSSNA